MPVDETHSKGVYENEDDNKGEFDFETDWETPDGLKLKTACCCCVCALDGDCNDWMQVQGKGVCLWCENGSSCSCCQCTDTSGEALACCQGASKMKNCSMTDAEKSLVCSNVGFKGVCCCCVVTTFSSRFCDPCGGPESCVKGNLQLFCVHARSAIPCDEDVKFEIGCCGFMCKEDNDDQAHE